MSEPERKGVRHEVILSPREREAMRAATMPAFCATIPPQDWLILQQLSERTRHGLLRQCLKLAFKARGRGGAER